MKSSRANSSRSCVDCVHFGGMRWIGTVPYVMCPHLPAGKSAEIVPSLGCGMFAESVRLSGSQQMLF